ncbi:MAG: antitoxin [Nocardiopsaceae bacterium]|nr:antitoxin [Nocardiopsaceae bacterium]
MPDFGELVNKAKNMASEHPDQVAKGVDKLQELVDKKTGGQYSDQIESAGDAVENYLGGREPGQDQRGQDQRGQQGQFPGQQGQAAGRQGQQSQRDRQDWPGQQDQDQRYDQNDGRNQ